jgi:hypothetical protein
MNGIQRVVLEDGSVIDISCTGAAAEGCVQFKIAFGPGVTFEFLLTRDQFHAVLGAAMRACEWHDTPERPLAARELENLRFLMSDI